MAGNSFFDRAPAKQTKKQHSSEYNYINIGGKSFQALAVAFIDYFKSASRTPDATLKRILERFYTHFPKFISHQAYLTPMDRMRILINSARKSEVVDCLAYVLRQITIDEVYAHPLNYRETFDGLDANTSKEYLRQPNTPLPSSVFRALAQALGITIVLSYTENEKVARLRDVYSGSSPNAPKIELDIQVNEGKYFPRVKNGADYAYVGQLAIRSPDPVVTSDQNDGTVAEFIDLIHNDNKQLLRTYSQWRQNLLMEGLTRENLMALYVKFLPSKSSIIPDPKSFFSRLTTPDGRPAQVDGINNEQYINEQLVGTLAEWISINQVDPDLLLDSIDKPTLRTASPAA